MTDKAILMDVDRALALTPDELRDRHRRYLNPGLASLLAILGVDKGYVRAEGMYVWDADDNRYLDFLAGYGALSLGHNPPQVIEAVDRVRDMPNILHASLNPVAAALAESLAAITPGDLRHTFFGNSGAEAVEGSLKIARAATGRTDLVSCDGGFHGKTFGALTVTGREKYRKCFEPLLPGVRRVPFGDLLALEDALKDEKVAGFILEPIQAEAGVIVPPDGYLRGVRELCTRYGTLMIADEIQTGFGRTGKNFACEHEDVTPDVMCLSKTLGGGIMPTAAFISTEEVWDKAYGSQDTCLLHTSTFGGNTRACAAGLAAIQVLVEDNLAQAAAEKGDYLLGRVKEIAERYPMIKAVRGRGLLVGLEFTEVEGGILSALSGGAVTEMAKEYLAAMVSGALYRDHNVITAYTLNNPNVIRLEPPLIVTKEQIDYVVDGLDQIFAKHGDFLSMSLSSAGTMLKGMLRR